MKIALGADHAGMMLSVDLAKSLTEAGHQVEDLGTYSEASVDYPDFAKKVADSVAGGKTELGILVCGTGIGMSITANKVHGVRAAVCRTEFEAKMARAHNDANILCLGQRVTGPGLAKEIVRAFISSSFEGGRHASRVAKITALEK
ncbi:MAG: ribose 5-phosphate isomerase B [Myxococcaceae bacterium]|nr:ribose 5-phosphate isomerase B [Myxococcaceae bacterium]